MLFPQNDICQHFRWHYNYAFIISSPKLKNHQENVEACWSVKKILKPIRASRTFADFYSINPDLHFVILNVISSKWPFSRLKIIWKSFIFLVQCYKSVKKILKPCWSVKKSLNHSRASRTFAWLLKYKPRFTFCDLECLFLKMTFFKTLDDMKVFYFWFLVQRFKSVMKYMKPCWSVKKILNHYRVSRTFAWLQQYKPRLTLCDLECYFLKMTFFQDFRWHESFLFFVSSPALQKRLENFEACWSVKRTRSPAGASRKFWSLLDFRWHESFLFLVSSAALQKRQENFEAWGIKKILKPTRASRTFAGRFFRWHFLFLVSSAALKKCQENFEACWTSRKFEALLERQENFEAKNVSQDFYGVENKGSFCVLDILVRFV